jgi:hypothetical protein
MTNREIGTKLEQLIRGERRITNEILEIINVALERRAYLELGYSSMFTWLVEGFGYSNAAAYRRIEAARLLKAVPEIKGKLEEGQVSLTTVSKAQSLLKTQERISGKKISSEQKSKIVKSIENKSARDAERSLFELLPEAAVGQNQERRKTINDSQTRLTITLSNETEFKLSRAKEILSHKFPSVGTAEIIDYALGFLLEKHDPLQRNSKTGSRAYIRKMTVIGANGGCSFKDPVTGKVCGNRHQLQIDHIVPKAHGGSDDPSNLRALCRHHNIHAAEIQFGRKFMEQFRRN